jgi:hypothetical protein
MQTMAVAAAAATEEPTAVASAGELTIIVPSAAACVWRAPSGETKY